MTERRYKFPASMTPGFYVVVDARTGIRVPGVVDPFGPEGARQLRYQRMLPPDREHKKAWAAKTIIADSVSELSQLIDDYFTQEAAEKAAAEAAKETPRV